MVETAGGKPRTSEVKERLVQALNDSRQVGFITYCISDGREIPSEIGTNFSREIFHLPDLTPAIIRQNLLNGYVQIGSVFSGVDQEILELSPEGALLTYKKLIEAEHEKEVSLSREGSKLQKAEVLARFPELKRAPYLSEYWQYFVPFLARIPNKAYFRYTVNHLRANILGFAQAAGYFGNEDIARQAFQLQDRYKDISRRDPLGFAGLL